VARARSTTDMLPIDPQLLEELVESDWTDCSGHMPRQLAPAPHTVMPHRQQMTGPTAPAPAEPLREQDRLCPLANVARIMATELPEDAKIARSAKVMMQEIVTEFLCFITSEANDISLTKGHKAVTQDDVVQAFENLDLGVFSPVLATAARFFAKQEQATSCNGSTDGVSIGPPMTIAATSASNVHDPPEVNNYTRANTATCADTSSMRTDRHPMMNAPVTATKTIRDAPDAPDAPDGVPLAMGTVNEMLSMLPLVADAPPHALQNHGQGLLMAGSNSLLLHQPCGGSVHSIDAEWAPSKSQGLLMAGSNSLLLQQPCGGSVHSIDAPSENMPSSLSSSEHSSLCTSASSSLHDSPRMQYTRMQSKIPVAALMAEAQGIAFQDRAHAIAGDPSKVHYGPPAVMATAINATMPSPIITASVAVASNLAIDRCTMHRSLSAFALNQQESDSIYAQRVTWDAQRDAHTEQYSQSMHLAGRTAIARGQPAGNVLGRPCAFGLQGRQSTGRADATLGRHFARGPANVGADAFKRRTKVGSTSFSKIRVQ